MAGDPQNRPMVRNERQQRAGAAEPLYDRHMSLYDSGGSVVVAVPKVARDILDFDEGDNLRVEIHNDGIWIPRGGNDRGD